MDRHRRRAVLRRTRRARLPPAAPLGPLGHVGGARLPRAPLHPRSGAEHQRRPDLDPSGPHVLPARRTDQGAPGGLLRLLPDLEPRQPGPGRAAHPVDEPTARTPPRPPHGRVGRQHPGPGHAEGPGLFGPAVRPVRRHALRRHRSTELAGPRRPPVRAGGLVRRHPLEPRAAAHHGVAGRHGSCGLRRAGRLVAVGDGPVRHGLRGRARLGLGLGLPEPRHLRELRLHHRLHRRGAGTDGNPRHPHALPAADRARTAHRDEPARRLRQAARRRTVLHDRDTGLRRRRGSHAPHPAHGSDNALHRLRRLVPGGELDDPGPADTAVGRRQAPADDGAALRGHRRAADRHPQACARRRSRVGPGGPRTGGGPHHRSGSLWRRGALARE